MLIECMVKRDGPTPIVIGNTKYLFMPLRQPGSKETMVTSVCDVTSEEHLAHMKKFPHTFREYQEGQPLPPELQRTVINLSGYAIEKVLNGDGYIVINKKAKEYAGSDGIWKPSRNNLSPFATEFIAYQWLKEEVQALASLSTIGEGEENALHDKQPDHGRTAKGRAQAGGAA